MSIKFLQQLLNANGAFPKLEEDGVFGAKTSAAVDATNTPIYVKIALKEIGTHEIKGPKHSPRVLEYMKATAGQYSDDETPWCGAFIAWVLRKANIPLVAYPERAKSWLDWGYNSEYPMMGALAVKSRSGGGHVTMVVGETKSGKLLCVGGNQNDEVNISAYNRTDFIEFRVHKDFKDYRMFRWGFEASSAGSEA